MKMKWAATAVFAATVSVSAVFAQTNQAGAGNGPAPSVTAANSSSAGAASQQLMSSTVHEAWISSGRDEDKFFDMVKQLAEISAAKRGVKLPDSEAAGRKMGNLIKASARRDPDQSLYAVVDAAVKQTAIPATK